MIDKFFVIAVVTAVAAMAQQITHIDPLGNTLVAYSMPDDCGVARVARPSDPIILQMHIRTLDPPEVDRIRQTLYQLSREPLNRFKVRGVLLIIEHQWFGQFEAANTLLQEIRSYATQEEVPVYAYSIKGIFGFGNIVSCAAQRIYTAKQALCGDVGIIDIFKNTRERLMIQDQATDTLHVTVTDPAIEVLRVGLDRAPGNRWTEWGPQEFSSFEELTESEYDMMISLLTKARSGLDIDQLLSIGSGPLMAPEAAAIGLIEVAGASLEHALRDLVVTAGCANRYRVIQLFSDPPDS